MVVRLSPSGPELDVFDGVVDPGELLGSPLDATTPAIAQPLEGGQVGRIVRFNGFQGMTLAAGTYNNFEIPDGITQLDIDPVGGDVIITGLKWLGRGNSGAFLVLGKFGTDSQVIFTHNDSGSSVGNRIFCPGQVPYHLRLSSDTALIWPFQTRFQIAERLVPPTGLTPEVSPTGITAVQAGTFEVRLTITAGGGGAADDVTLFDANCPTALRILDAQFMTSTNVGGSTVQLRSASGGGGSPLTTALSTAATGTARNNDVQTRTIALNGSAFLRRSDSGVAGTLILTCART